MFSRIRVYVGSLVALAAVTSAWIYELAPNVSAASVRAALCFAVLSAISGMHAYKKADMRQTGSVAFLPMLASVVIAPNWLTVAFLGTATCLVEIVARRVLIKAVFNIAQAMFWVGFAILAFRYLGGHALIILRTAPHSRRLRSCTQRRSRAQLQLAKTESFSRFGGAARVSLW
jgi:hypothetical protein